MNNTNIGHIYNEYNTNTVQTYNEQYKHWHIYNEQDKHNANINEQYHQQYKHKKTRTNVQ